MKVEETKNIAVIEFGTMGRQLVSSSYLGDPRVKVGAKGVLRVFQTP